MGQRYHAQRCVTAGEYEWRVVDVATHKDVLWEKNAEAALKFADLLNAADARSGADELAEALELILPLAKGYAAAHEVGSNAEYIWTAETALAKHGEPK